MANKQTRRTVRVTRLTYDRMRDYCEVNNVSMSTLVETCVGKWLAEQVVPTSTLPAALIPDALAVHLQRTPRF